MDNRVLTRDDMHAYQERAVDARKNAETLYGFHPNHGKD